MNANVNMRLNENVNINANAPSVALSQRQTGPPSTAPAEPGDLADEPDFSGPSGAQAGAGVVASVPAAALRIGFA
jgi:hypothetical protein